MVDEAQIAQGRWSPAVVPISAQTMAFLHQQVGEGVVRKRGAAGRSSNRQLPAGCPIPIEQTIWGATGMAWTDIDNATAGTSPVNIVGVVSPTSADEVSAVLVWAHAMGVSVIPRGGGTSVVGGLQADQPSVLLDMQQMARIVDFDPIDALVHVQAGVTGPTLEAWLAERGFTFGHFPQSWERASMGGYAVTASSGQASRGYGRFRDNVGRMLLITPNGPWHLDQVPASAMGPDFLGVVSASEGTLGVVTDLDLRVRPKPGKIIAEGALVPSWERAVHAARELTQADIAPHVLRISDGPETQATWAMSVPTGSKTALAHAYCRLRGVRDGCLMIMQWQGGAELTGRRRAAWQILRKYGVVSVGRGVGAQWVKHRFEGPYLRDTLLDHGYFVETFETATRWSNVLNLHTAVLQTMADLLPRAYTMAHISHVYATGSSLYFTVIGTSDVADIWPEVKASVTHALHRHGGTASHHHGVGTLHAPWLHAEMGEQGAAVWAAVKHACDPGNIMNPTVWNAWQR